MRADSLVKVPHGLYGSMMQALGICIGSVLAVLSPRCSR
jgi:hypothetical protein